MAFPSFTGLTTPRPNPRIGVPFSDVYDANTGRWKVQPAQVNPTIVTFDLHPQFVEGIQPGMLRSFDVNMGNVGVIAIRPYFHIANSQPPQPTDIEFEVWQQTNPFNSGPQLQTLQHTCADKYKGFQYSTLIFENEHMAKVLQIAQFELQQRMAQAMFPPPWGPRQ